MKVGDRVQHKNWAGVIVAITPNRAEDDELWCEVRADDGNMRYCPLVEVTTNDLLCVPKEDTPRGERSSRGG